MKFIEWLGFQSSQEKRPYDYDPKDYTGDSKLRRIDAHLLFLKQLEAEENNRLTLLETKTSQIVAQTGIIFSLLSLFIPIFIDKLQEMPILFKIAFLITLLLTFGAYVLTIHHAVKNYNVKKFIYSKSSPVNVIKYQKESLKKFKTVEVRDLLHSINQNEMTNNRKADNLIYSYRLFKLGNIFTAILVCILCVSLMFVREKSKFIDINPIRLNQGQFDSLFSKPPEQDNPQLRILIPTDSVKQLK